MLEDHADFAAHGRALLDQPEEDWLAEVRRFAIDAMMDMIRRDLAALGVVPATVLVQRVEPGLPAAEAGLEPGDLLIAIGENKIKDIDDLGLKLEGAAPGDIVKFFINRTLKQGQRYYIQEDEITLRARSLTAI